MKIGFTGSGGTGKTTTLILLTQNFKEVPVLPSPARAVFNRWNIKESDQEKMGLDELSRLQNEIYSARRQQEVEIPDFISDRTLLDNFVYDTFRCYRAYSNAHYFERQADIINNMQSYDHIFYFPLLTDVEIDGFRESMISYQTIIDSLIYTFLEKHGIRYKRVPDGTADERARWIEREIHMKDAIHDLDLNGPGRWENTDE